MSPSTYQKILESLTLLNAVTAKIQQEKGDTEAVRSHATSIKKMAETLHNMDGTDFRMETRHEIIEQNSLFLPHHLSHYVTRRNFQEPYRINGCRWGDFRLGIRHLDCKRQRPRPLQRGGGYAHPTGDVGTFR